ncbi:unnamed protein product [Ostreobium quekettii]|uniref:40S ribosomal protein S19 n=1 Tax=Ostreobium quekettii TaxID=121088 RepID=A0A8S1IKQ7_9CHLO|nr:unnamed protein product [Ostreobium quekettii]CAD7697837.1 unnamed protein product [Ostreobium quekettii]|eukprot:evm.model.scf_2341.2 EVM.evm.TU.scf_2341.2   scf_2341:4328-5978(-)
MASKAQCVKDVPAEVFIAAYAQHLKEKLEVPPWVDIVKTAPFKELPPRDPDWYFIRAASILRRLYLSQDIGVGCFRRIYGGRTSRRGARPEKKAIASAGLIRHILIQLEKVGFVKKSDNEKGGRRLTAKGQRDMDLVAGGAKFKTYVF